MSGPAWAARQREKLLVKQKGKTMARSVEVGVLVLLVVVIAVPAAAPAAEVQLKLTVKVAAAGGKNVPVFAEIDVPAQLKCPPEDISVTLRGAPGARSVPGQILLDGQAAQLWWILPEAKVGTAAWTATLSDAKYAGKDVFAFEDTQGKHMDLLFAGRRVNRFMYERDTSTKQRAHETYKTYHHVFDAEGKDYITKGPGGKYTHHRGVYIGWSRLTVAKKSYDTWHMSRGCTQAHRKFLRKSAGPVLASSTALVHWLNGEGKVLLAEERQTLVFRQGPPAVMLMEFRPKLMATSGEVYLNGDPEHAGMQYRPHNDVAVHGGAKKPKPGAPNGTQTVYEFHQDGIKTGGQRLNRNKDLPWAGMSYALKGKRYSVQHMNHSSNPKGTIYSAYRSYGRFGAFFKKTIEADGSLSLRYRILVLTSDMPTRREMDLRRAAFNNPPVVQVAK